jgi:hypothetical protein
MINHVKTGTEPFETVHADLVEKIAQKHKLEPNNELDHPKDPAYHRSTAAHILNVEKFPELNGISGVHTSVDGPKYIRFSRHKFSACSAFSEYMFDLRDINGNEVLPFTAKKPLFAMLALYNNIYDVFPELKHVHTATIGLCKNDTLKNLVFQSERTGIEQKFDTCLIKYKGGLVYRETS